MVATDIATRVWNHTFKLDPIVRSLLDTDFYKLLMLQMIRGLHPDVDATFSLTNRTADPDSNQDSDIFLVEARAGGTPVKLSASPGTDAAPAFSPDGRFVMPDGEGGHLFSLSTNVTLAAETTSRLTLLLDVPCVDPKRDGFGSMLNCARSLGGKLDATIVDDSDAPLQDEALAEINGQVLAFYQEMEEADIPAGSHRAKRLFS